jgi:hypothetical protein
LPLIVTRGWPGSVVEQLKIVEPLTNPHGARRKRVGRLPFSDPVDARLWFVRQADDDRVGPRPRCTCLDSADEAARLPEIRGAGVSTIKRFYMRQKPKLFVSGAWDALVREP